MRIVALIPARAGSKRIPGKNSRMLGDKTLIQWTVDAAIESGIFSAIAVCTDMEMAVAGTTVDLVSRPPSPDDEPDIVWVRLALQRYPQTDAFAILRPTSPFRTADTIRRAWDLFQRWPDRSLRAMEPAKQNPAKMWDIREAGIARPVVTDEDGNALCHLRQYSIGRGAVPYHSSPTQTLPTYYIQNASLEIVPVSLIKRWDVIADDIVTPFLTEGWEGFDINTPEDWDKAEAHAQTLLARVP